jgi:hypothetical protein
MAKSALNGHVNQAGPISYTVPALKYAILSLSSISSGGSVTVNGVSVFTWAAVSVPFKPLTLAAGDVLGASGGGADCAYSGFLFDA